ncbi:disks large homolog 5 isoform X2 [Planococcus citri]|uniref:disks large homolog 5 isoform X2 n=1 Tax=Planococcus citri TaxID=170843 RepID=UPI0031F85929
MASGNSAHDNNTLTRSYSERSSDRNRESVCRDYDALKQQCDKVYQEVQLLRRQNSETNRRCEQTMKEKEYYRSQHHAAMSQLEAAAEESSTLRAKYSELVTDKQRLDREISELRSACCNQGDVNIAENGTNDSFNNCYVVTINKYEALKDDYEALRQRYDDLLTTHNATMNELEFKREEITRLKKEKEGLVVERNNAIMERNGLKQQCTQAVHKWDITLREKKELQETLKKMQQQLEEAKKEVINARTIRINTSKENKRLQEERNAAMQEYNLIMSERDTVHKEMEKLTEDKAQAIKKIKLLENESKQYLEEKKTLSYHIETLKREIASALHDRDKALKECNNFREKFGEFTAKEESQRESFKSRFDYSFIRERDQHRKDSCEMQSTSMDMFSKCQKETMDNLDQANQEIEKLHKYIDKQQTELQEALQEAEVSKRRRDWAFTERDKIVLERESIRTLCDRLRKERDRAVSDLAEALRDSDDIKRQRNETTKELKVLKEKMEAQFEKENRMLQLNTTGHSYSHDSAIDTDLQEWDTEMLNIDLNSLTTVDDLGVELVGGRDDPYYPNDSGIYVSSVSKGSILEGKLRVNDCILRVNNLDCSNVSKRMVIESLRSNGGSCNILVKRRRIGARSLFTTQLQLNNYDHGLALETGMYICKIAPGSLAAKEGNLAVGDRVLSVNNKPMDGLKSAQEAMAILNQPADVLIITTLKSTHCSSNCGGGSNRDVYKKYTNSSTQTQTEQRPNFIMRYDNRQSYPVSSKVETGKQTSNMGKWDTVNRAKDLVRERRFLKFDKKQNRNSSPITAFDQERDDALAELDSVLESHTDRNNRSTPQQQPPPQVQRKPQKNKELEKNGGTWPKARIGPLIEHSTGTILHPRKAKERSPLSLLLNPTSNYSLPQPFCNTSRPEESHPTSQKNSLDFSVKSGNIGKDMLEHYVKKKTSKYAISDVVDVTNEPPHSRAHSQIYNVPCLFTPLVQLPHRGHQLLDLRYPSSQSGESISLTDGRTYCFEPSYDSVSQFHHKYSPSADSTYHKVDNTNASNLHSLSTSGYQSDEIPGSYHRYEGGTFPRKKENPRFRIPSNPSVASKTSGKLSTGSIIKSSNIVSPVATYQGKLLNPLQNKRNSLPNYCWSHNPKLDERTVTIENSGEPLGFQVQYSDSGAVFVSAVAEHSKADRQGLQVGDQVLDVFGMNMRNCPYGYFERVLGQCGDSVEMRVQYNPHKYNAVFGSDGSATSGEDESRSDTHSGSPTPCNSPTLSRKSTPSSTLSHVPYTVTTLTRPKPSEKNDSVNKASVYEPRLLKLETQKCSNLGISLVGGNAVGIYVHSVTAGSLAYNAGLRTGDHILEYNGTDLRHATAEEAAFELAKPADKVNVLVQNELDRYNEIKDKPGDSFYIRALFDRTGDVGDYQLQFRKDDILYVDNTMFNGVPGNWRAWLIDQDGYHQQYGIIPSKYKVEEELLKRSLGDLEGDARRGTRRSFFRRKKQRSDSKELASFSNINLGGFSDSGSLNEETTLASYQKVTRLDSEPMLRPVLIIGPLADCVIEKLLADFPDKFNRCIPEVRYFSQAVVEKGVNDNLLIDYRKKGNSFECTSVSAIKDSLHKHCHCILDISLASVERLHYHHVYPIVLLIKFKSTKQIKEVKDTRYPMEKITAKAAKEMYEHAQKLESEYRHYISAIIPAGVNVAYMCTQIKAAVDSEQNKTIWVPSSTA